MFVIRDVVDNALYLQVTYDCLKLARGERAQLLKDFPETNIWHKRLKIFKERNGKSDIIKDTDSVKCKNDCKFGCLGSIHNILKIKKTRRKKVEDLST